MGRRALILLLGTLAGCGSGMRRVTLPEHPPDVVFEAAERALRTQFPDVRERDPVAGRLVSAPRYVGGADAGLLQAFLKVEAGPGARGAVLFVLVTRRVFDAGGWFGIGASDGFEDDGRDERAERWIEHATRAALRGR